VEEAIAGRTDAFWGTIWSSIPHIIAYKRFARGRIRTPNLFLEHDCGSVWRTVQVLRLCSYLPRRPLVADVAAHDSDWHDMARMHVMAQWCDSQEHSMKERLPNLTSAVVMQ
jgi:hypothetical protein